VLGHRLLQRGLEHRLGQLHEQPIRTRQRQTLVLGQAHQVRGLLLGRLLGSFPVRCHTRQCRGHRRTLPASTRGGRVRAGNTIRSSVQAGKSLAECADGFRPADVVSLGVRDIQLGEGSQLGRGFDALRDDRQREVASEIVEEFDDCVPAIVVQHLVDKGSVDLYAADGVDGQVSRRGRAGSGLVPSMGTIGDCYDNAVIESFWGRMQTELLNRRRWKTRIELANAIFEYLEIFHNRQRRHSALGMLTPNEYEKLRPTQLVA
jgi:transposase InsO family protein